MSPFNPQILSALRGNSPRTAFRWGLQWIVVLALVASLFLSPVQLAKASTIPTFSIVAVTTDTSVTIQTYNFPANQIFTVRMGAYGTLGIGGIVVDQTNSGAGGSFQETYTIPAALKGSQRIAIRLDSPQGFFAYNWFWNAASTVPTAIPGTGYTGIPTFNIQAVARDQNVTVLTNNYPANQTFTVRMGAIGTRGVGGIVVGTVNSGAGGAFQATFDIPAALAGSTQIAIRMDSPAGFFAYNWFWNNSTNPTAGPSPTVIPGTGYSGFPTFSIQAVVRDQSVTILTNNVPPNQTFTVRMGAMGTRGIGGIVVGTTDSGAGGSYTATYSIPAALAGSTQIAIRMDSNLGFFAYNWFWNNTTGTSGPTSTPVPSITPGGPTITPVPTSVPGTGYTGIPSFSISSVVRDQTVTVLTNNYPPNQTFTVRMNVIHTQGVGGIVVGTVNSGAGGAFQATFSIPAALAGSSQISIRMDSPAGYFAYNWFWNNTYP